MDHTNPALEKAILEAPDSPDAYLVYGDWLQTQDNPSDRAFGEFIALSIELEARPWDCALHGRARSLFSNHRERWFVALSEEWELVVLGWRFGFLRRLHFHNLTLGWDGAEDHRMSRLGRTPIARFADEVIVDLREDAQEYGPVDFLPYLGAYPNLRSLTILGAIGLQGLGHHPRLERLHVSMPHGVYGPSFFELLPPVKHLVAERAENADEIVDQLAELPLRTLDLSYGTLTKINPARFRHLEKLVLIGNRLEPAVADALVKELGDRVVIGWQDSPSLREERAERFRKALHKVETERSFEEKWDHDFRPNPWKPLEVVKTELAHEEFLPRLIEQSMDRWCIEALRMVGPIAGPNASDMLGLADEVALHFVDEPRWWTRGAHDLFAIAKILYARDPRDLALLLRRLITSGWERTFTQEPKNHEILSWLTKNHRELAPRDFLRDELKSWLPDRAGPAATRLVEAHFPEDADIVVEAMLRGTGTRAARVTVPIAPWLGSHPRSLELAAQYPEERDAILEERRKAVPH